MNVEATLAALADGDSEAERALRRLGEDARPALQAALGSPDWRVAALAADELGRLGGPDVRAALEGLLAAGDAGRRAGAIGGLRRLGDPAAIPALGRLLGDERPVPAPGVTSPEGGKVPLWALAEAAIEELSARPG